MDWGLPPFKEVIGMMKWKRFLTAALAVGMLMSAMPMEALAANKIYQQYLAEGACGVGCWGFRDNGDSISTEKTDSGTYVYTTASRYRVVEARVGQ